MQINKLNNNSNEVALYNIYGKLLYQSKIENNNTRIDLNNFANGIYLLQIISDNAVVGVAKIIKE